jgi:uncharacterized damage-inducible protein DinB
MNARQAIQLNLDLSDYISQGYLGDLTESELLHRPATGANHIKWQLGHLIASEHDLVEDCFPGTMPALPADFATRYHRDRAGSDNPGDFHTKEELLAEHQRQRQAALQKLHSLADSDLDAGTPEKMQSYAPTVGSLFSMLGTHWVMHAGQWAVIRRQLGRAPLF